MDAFYASVEQRDRPELRGKPLIVGGPSRRGVVCTCSYEARPFGVRSAMPMQRALTLCPQALVVPPRMRHYAEVSAQIMGILKRFSPLIEPLSLDEAFLDVTHSQALFGDGADVARAIKKAIRDELGLVASAGVAGSKFVAKIGSDFKKPDGLTIVPAGTEAAFLAPLPIGRMWGIGPKSVERFEAAGIRTIGALREAQPRHLRELMGTDWAEVVVQLAAGIDEREVIPERENVSVGAEETFEFDLRDRESIERTLLAHSERIAARLTTSLRCARVVVLKVKYADFKLLTRRVTLPEPVSDTTSIHRAACELLGKVDLGRPIRLTGVSVSDLMDADAIQRPLFQNEAKEKREALEKVRMAATARFGEGSLVHAGALSRSRK